MSDSKIDGTNTLDNIIEIPSFLSNVSYDNGISTVAASCDVNVEFCKIYCQNSGECDYCQKTTQCSGQSCRDEMIPCQICENGEKPSGSPPPAPTITSAVGGNKTISWAWSSVDGADGYTYAYRESSASSAIYGSTTGTSITIRGLKSNTIYVVNVRAYNSYGESEYAGGRYVNTEPKPLHWSWDSSNGEATTTATQTAYEAITKKGLLSDFNYKVWNDMCTKVSNVRLFAEVGAWDTTGGGLTISETKMNANDKTLTATRFNSLKYQIGSHVPTGIGDKVAGNIVYGSYFVTLMEKLNAWIDSLD